jgi:hypothetical protein
VWPGLQYLPTERAKAIASAQKDDGYRCRHSLGGLTAASAGNDHGYLVLSQIGRQCRQPCRLALRKAIFDCQVIALDKARFPQASSERGEGRDGISARPGMEEPDRRHLGLLRPRRERPCGCAAKQYDELAPFQLTGLHALPQPGMLGSIA